MTHYMKKGDTSPSLLKQCQDENGRAIDLSTATTVQFTMRNSGGTKIIDLQSAAVFTGELPNGLSATAEDGWVEYVWQTGDTDATGDYDSEFKVVYQDGSVETFPNSGFEKITINPNL